MSQVTEKAAVRRKVRTNAAIVASFMLFAGCRFEPEPERSETSRNAASPGKTPDSVIQEDPSAAQQEVETDLGEVEILAENLEVPWSVTFADETPLISERDSARILEVGVVEQTAMQGGEGGLLGIAFHKGQLYT